MAPGPPLSYLDRVVMEIIETERTYVRDLRMIVEVCQHWREYVCVCVCVCVCVYVLRRERECMCVCVCVCTC